MPELMVPRHPISAASQMIVPAASVAKALVPLQAVSPPKAMLVLERSDPALTPPVKVEVPVSAPATSRYPVITVLVPPPVTSSLSSLSPVLHAGVDPSVVSTVEDAPIASSVMDPAL